MSDHNSHSHHIVPLRVYYLTLFGLLLLTALTVGVSYLNFGSTVANLAVAMAIALTKAALVVMFFMGLKWDSFLIKSCVYGTIIALFTFFFFIGADLGYRSPETPVVVQKAAATIGMDDIKKLEVSTPELVSQGKQIYAVNCAVCHGAAGQGDGVAGKALNPVPRNFYDPSSKWTQGTSAKSLYVTLTKGVPGTGMAGFPTLKPADRWALVHYIHTMVPDIQSVSKLDGDYLKVLKDVDGVGEGASAKATIPVDLAIERMLEEKN